MPTDAQLEADIRRHLAHGSIYAWTDGEVEVLLRLLDEARAAIERLTVELDVWKGRGANQPYYGSRRE